ncbi:hypothetical protein PSTH1771_07410 [Pseudomonas syringae pv. theae]|nr:hypothetical protein PSTH68_19815 [Pseudomonas syringae pv. theae]GKQ45165.1 hypothetical protein PSTH2693_08435 [Pseudomonas syringae pv. theae]GKS04820.1 hypothetical protein PSTH1771_07410 [Pseudomonas syringae pv. theae]
MVVPIDIQSGQKQGAGCADAGVAWRLVPLS